MTQAQAAKFLSVSLRSYISYENNPKKAGTMKYQYMADKLAELSLVDEEHGILSLSDIQKTLREIFSNYPIDFCYLFGSYAKAKANEKSDVDLLISTSVTGLEFFGLVEEIREKLHKKVDLLTINQIVDNQELLTEILRDGIKIYR